MLPFVQYIKPDYQVNWHHQLLCHYLDLFVAGLIKKLMVFMPPQHGKSELVSRKLPAYIFGRIPDAKVIAASYAAELIQGMNRDVQRTIESDEYARLFPGTTLNTKNIRTVSGSYLRNNDIFEIVGTGGQYRCAGVGGGLTGFPALFGIIDDPYKDYQEAMSETVRRAVWEWYTSVFLSRMHVNSQQLLTLTRWHELDLAGQILELEGDEWTVLKLPAISGDPPGADDIRQPGEALWPERFPVSLLDQRKRLNARQFEALYQQNPRPRSGNMFDRDLVQIVDEVPWNADRVRRWDMAATEDGGDWTVGILMARAGGTFYIEDYLAVQLGTHKRNALIRATAARDAARYDNTVLQVGPQDPGAAGKDVALDFIRMLAGYPVDTEIESGSKELRAEPFSDQWGAGNVALKRAEWNAQYLNRMELFPHGGRDETDASSGGFNRLALRWQDEIEQVVVYDERVSISSY
jgi:predicted phage terminase large subunit-like protein